MAAVILVVVVVIVGGAGFAGLSSIGGQGTTTRTGCYPPTAVTCGASKLNDVVLFVALEAGVGQTMVSLNLGSELPASLSLSNNEVASSFNMNWGDNSTTTQSAPDFTHTYTGIGTYVLSGTALVGTVIHTGTTYLFPVQVIPTLAEVSAGQLPTLTTTFSNGSSSSPNFPWITQGGTVKVSASYATLPTASGYTAGSPSIVGSPGSTKVSAGNTTTSATGTFTFSSPGQYWLTMIGPIHAPGGVTTYQNYTWSVYVGATGQPLGCTGCRNGGASGATSPHKGTIYAYEIVPGGATSLDPAVDYESVGTEVIGNVFETLIQYNGTATASFVPVLSTCIPGPAASGPTSCAAQYGGNDLNAGNGVYWTFPIDKNASFYDPSTGNSWGVYPSDVMFSVMRTLMWLQNPSQYVTNGWIIGQSLLPYNTNPSWDMGLHAPWNNTPQNMLSSMLVNDSTYCPAKAMSQEHGCITFVVNGSGHAWGYFLEFIEDSEGASVVPCGWYTHMGAGIPGFTTSAANGDGPCLLPGGVNNTQASAFTSYVTSVSPTLYDSIIVLDTTSYQNPYPQVRWAVVGSGPYWLQSVNQGQGYILKANPDYLQPNCAGLPNCYPAHNDYAGTVYVFWEPSSTPGVEQYIAGQADYAGIYPTDIPTIFQLEKENKVVLYTLPTLNLFPEGFGMTFDPASAQTASSETVNIPADFFANVGLRMFMAVTFPYWSYINVDNLVDGIPFIQGEGGAIPQYLGNYYPENITWPGMNASTGQWPQVWQDPSATDVIAPSTAYAGSPMWWWSNITYSKSPYYDPELAACSSGSPCAFTLNGEQGNPPLDAAIDQWISIIEKVTGGALVPTRWDPEFTQYVVGLGVPPGTSYFDTYVAGWAPDYPDPTDYMVPFWMPDGSYTYSAAYNETLNDGSYSGCSAYSATDFADLAYWANYAGPLVPQACQGTAYTVQTWAETVAALMPVGPERILYYNMLSQIANKLVLDIYNEQQVGVGTYAAWINPSGITTNPLVSQLWFNWLGNNVW